MMHSTLVIGVGVGIEYLVFIHLLWRTRVIFIFLIFEKMLMAQVLLIMVKFVIKLTLKQFSETKLNAQSWSIYNFLP